MQWVYMRRVKQGGMVLQLAICTALLQVTHSPDFHTLFYLVSEKALCIMQRITSKYLPYIVQMQLLTILCEQEHPEDR